MNTRHDDTPSNEGPAVSVAIPCFNEETCIDELVARMTAACRSVVADSYEIILVNDGSTDRTWPMIQSHAEKDSHVVGINLSRNFGQQAALLAGLTIAAGERIFIIDADLQDPPELLGEMMAHMDRGVDVVYGQRRKRDGETALKQGTSALFYRLLGKLTEIKIPMDSGDFRLMSRRALDALLAMPEQCRFTRGMISWVGFPQEALLYDRAERFAGTTKYSMRALVRLAFDAITSFSTLPLRFASYMGLILALFSIPLIIYTLGSWIRGGAVEGWTSLMTIVVILGSAQMFVLGMIGEYLGRTYIETKRRPLFLIQDIVRRPATPDDDGTNSDDT